MSTIRVSKCKNLILLFLILILSLACGLIPSIPSPAPPTLTSTRTLEPTTAPTETLTPTIQPTITNTPGPTPIPGTLVVPISSLDECIPWLPIEDGKEPMSVYFGFNVEKPPFNNVLVRQALSAAIDREQIARDAKVFGFREVSPATSLTPSKILGRDLYNEVGMMFNPAKAKELLAQAGFPDGANFPEVTLIVSKRPWFDPEAYSKLAESIVGMWNTHLGIVVTLKVEPSWDRYINTLETNPPDIYEMGWGADYNDPDNFSNFLFHSNGVLNYGYFSNAQYDDLVEEAAQLCDPEERQLLYIQAEQILVEKEAGIIPLFHTLYY